jgi:hypothetical protein
LRWWVFSLEILDGSATVVYVPRSVLPDCHGGMMSSTVLDVVGLVYIIVVIVVTCRCSRE